MSAPSTVSSDYKLYTPGQVALAAIIGGPLGGGIVMRQNFNALGQNTLGKKTLIWSVVGLLGLFVLGLLFMLLALWLHIPTLGYGLAAVSPFSYRQLTKQYQGEAITKRLDEGEFQQSWGAAVGFGLLGGLITFIPFLIFFFLMGLLAAFLIPSLLHASGAH